MTVGTVISYVIWAKPTQYNTTIAQQIGLMYVCVCEK